MPSDTAFLDATAQAELVRSGQASPLELVDAAIARVERLDGTLNAVVTPLFERAREAAAGDLPDGPFRGVPFLLKDLATLTAGEPYHAGVKAARQAGYVADHDAELTRRFRAAGLVWLGKTSTSELGLLPTTEAEAYGPTRNPASECGLVGLKPSRGRVPLWPDLAEAWGGMVSSLAVSRSVRDTAAVLDAVAGPCPGDLHTPPPPARPYLQEVGASPGALRVGVLTTAPDGATPTDPECAAAAEAAGRLLESVGHRVEQAHPAALADPELVTAFLPCYGTWTAAELDYWGRWLGRPLTADDVEVSTWAVAEMGRQVSATQYLAGLWALHRYLAAVQSWWAEGWDLLLTPTIAEPPPILGQFTSPPENPLQAVFRSSALVAFTIPFNITGQPAVSLPLGWTATGLPLGVQLVAAYGREDLLLRVAAQLEAAAPWADRRPPVHA